MKNIGDFLKIASVTGLALFLAYSSSSQSSPAPQNSAVPTATQAAH